MAGTRFAFALTLSFALAAPALGDGGRFGRKGKADPARVRSLVEVLRTDPDERKRKAALAELAEVDARASPDAVPAIVLALQNDRAEAVRAAAAAAIGRFNAVFPVAGVALETAAEADPSPAVRGAARQALWEYHLSGYRSARGADGIAGQTAEPPRAKPVARVPVTSEPPTALVPVTALKPVTPPPPPASLPAFGLRPGPRVSPVSPFVGARTLFSAVPPYPNLTTEPPLAKPTARPVPVPVVAAEPPIKPRWPEPSTAGKPPPLALDLPSVVTPP